MPATGALIGTPASISESVAPQTVAIDDEPFDSSVSETTRIVYGNSTPAAARSRSRARRASRDRLRAGPDRAAAAPRPTENGGKL